MKDLRRKYKFVSLLLSDPVQSVSNGNVILSNRTKRCSLPVMMVNQLKSQGVLRQNGFSFRPSDVARSWLKRQRLELLKQEMPPTPGGEQVPVKCANDTIVRLSRKSKGANEAFLAAHHVLVANKVSALIEKSQLRPSVTQNFSVLLQSGNSSNGASADLSDMAIDCRKRLDQLVVQLPKDCAAVVVDICGFDKGLQQVEFERRWPRRSAKLVLRMGLDHAADFWKISAQAQGRDRSR